MVKTKKWSEYFNSVIIFVFEIQINETGHKMQSETILIDQGEF